MKNLIITLILALGVTASIKSQTIITWEVLKDVTFEEVFSEEFQGYYQVPKFGKKISSLNGKKVQIRGYIIPVDVIQDYYVLSANPYSSCFFCGGAGPESVMEVQIVGEHSGLRMDQIITFEGKLRLNPDDIYQLSYILEDAKVIE
ncbi:MAG: DUF3299 domain-containing protein [Flavobacteriales bacterium]|jgi:hypothetical protein|nr:DUF3299 domain-containing protein [Flavobacteriales bacterium]